MSPVLAQETEKREGKVPVFDFFLQWLMGAQTSGGSEVGEAMYAASRIRDGDPGSWVAEWEALAVRVEARARASLQAGHRVSARNSFLRAYSYYRAPLALISPLEKPDEYKSRYAKARACFREAAGLFDRPFEPVAIPFEGKTLPGYLLMPSDDGQPRKTLVMIGGGDTFCEDLYAYVGPGALERGYNVLLVDLPEQGITPFDGLVARPDTETPMGAVLDHVLARPGVDQHRLAVFGISGGGYLAPRAAMHEKRIKALVAFSMLLDGYAVWTETMNAPALARAERLGLVRVAERLHVRKAATARVLFDIYKWKSGARTIDGMLAVASQGFVVDPSQITCPTLILVAEQEYEEFSISRRWQDEALAKIDNPNKRLIVMPRDEGADSHAGGTNLSLVGQVTFDWLDELFG